MEHDWDVRPPSGWKPVAAICREMFAERHLITEQINAQIQREITDFHEPASPISRSDLAWSTGGGVANFLRGVAERRAAREEDIAFQRLVGARSVMRGLPLEPLITAYQVGFRELWSILASRAAGGPASPLLLEHGSIVWERLVATTTAVTEGYQQELARRETFEATATAHLLEALGPMPRIEEAVTLARGLGFDPEGFFQAIAIGGPITASDVARTLAAALQASGASASSTQRGRIAVVITQGADRAAFEAALAGIPQRTAAGVGRRGAGIAGVRLSLTEAELALGLALVRKNICRFDKEWLLATLTAHRDSIDGLLEAGIATARSRPHLADAIQAFAASGFSVAEGARRLVVSPNSLRYRLTRWRTLTGWDPWTFDGLSRSLLALGLAEGSSDASPDERNADDTVPG